MSKSDARHTRIQWNVGQGGFHTGAALGSNARTDPIFRYIYDCGSISAQPALETCLSEYVKSLGVNKRVDAVFLSHIDNDHVNGLPDLFGKHAVTTQRIFLPLLTPVGRLLTLARPGLRIDSFLVDLASDPVAALGDLTDAEVVRVASGDERSDPGDGQPLQALTNDTDDGSSVEVIGPDGTWTPAGDGSVGMSDSAAVRISTMDRHNDWLLGFYIESDSRDRTADFVIELSHGLGIDAHALEVDDPDFIRNLLTDPRSLRVLRNAYRAAKVDPNQGSMILLSGPSRGVATEQIRFGRFTIVNSGNWLLTGDAKLKTRLQVERMAEHFRGRIERTGVISLPHHGSRNNFHEALLDIGDGPLTIAFASAGSMRENWSHPAASVVRHVASSSAIPWTVTESADTRIRAVVY